MSNHYWDKSPDYPTKRDVCSFCHHRDDLKLAFDLQRYICVNAHSCVLRWSKAREEGAI